MARAASALTDEIASRPADGRAASAAVYIRDLARRHGIRYERTELDTWAEAVTRASGDDVVLDSIEELLVALTRAGFISDIDSTLLHARYLDERESVAA